MAIFKQKKTEPKPAKTKGEIISAQLHKAVTEGAAAWVQQNLSDHRLYGCIQTYLTNALEEAINDAVGIETTTFEGARVRWNSPLHDKIKTAANAHAQATLDSYLKGQEKGLPKKLPTKLRAAIDRTYEEAYMERLVDVARDRGHERAEKDVDALLDAMLKKVKR